MDSKLKFRFGAKPNLMKNFMPFALSPTALSSIFSIWLVVTFSTSNPSIVADKATSKCEGIKTNFSSKCCDQPSNLLIFGKVATLSSPRQSSYFT